MSESVSVLDRYASLAEALDAARGGLAWVARNDATTYTGIERCSAAVELAAIDAVHAAASAAVLGAFNAAEDYAVDGARGPRPWLMSAGRMSKGEASAALGWMRRLGRRRHVQAALAGGLISQSYARQICDWVEMLPAEVQESAEDILVVAAIGGALLEDLAVLFEDIRARTARPDTDPGDSPDGVPGDGDDDGFASRHVQLDTYLNGRGALTGDLQPDGAQALRIVLDYFGAPAGPEDFRSKGQRDHDGLVAACQQLIAAGMTGHRAGQPTQIVLHMTLAQLLGQAEDNPGLAAWLAARGLTAPPGAACDAQIVPVLTGNADPAVLDELLNSGTGTTTDTDTDTDTDISGSDSPEGGASDSGGNSASSDTTGSISLPDHGDTATSGGGVAGAGLPSGSDSSAGGSLPSGSGPLAGGSLLPGGDALAGAGLPAGGELLSGGVLSGVLPGSITGGSDGGRGELLLADAVRLLSGPTGLGSWLRGQAGYPAASVSLPLDIGRATDTIPTGIRRAVAIRDGHCRWPGGCDLVPDRCQVHHVVHRARGGPTAITNLVLLCGFHHQNIIHRRGWTLRLHADGSTSATSPDGSRVLHSHGPTAAA